MRIELAIVILRHNTNLGGDVRLAAREFDALVGESGQIIASRRELIAALGGSRAAQIPELSTKSGFVAVIWRYASVDGLTKLIQRSAFAQEIFVQDENPKIVDYFRARNLPVTADLIDFARPVVVSIAWNYLIESEGVLDDARRSGRVQLVIDLLLDPYRHGIGSRASLKLRRAKKTTLSLSHDLHIYKAKFFPRMVRALLNIFGTREGLVVDPFCGSGTALLEASLIGIDSVGFDIDPICRAISNTKVQPFLNPDQLLEEFERFENALLNPKTKQSDFIFPSGLAAKIARRDRIDGTQYLPEIKDQSEALAEALSAVPLNSVNRQLLSVLASDAVTKKVRYRFIGVGNGKYTIEIVKQPLVARICEKLERCRQLAMVFQELRDIVGLSFGKVSAGPGDARELSSWPVRADISTIVTSPPYLPASSGREHYASSRALAFAVLRFNPGEHGYYDATSLALENAGALDAYPEAVRLLEYLASDASEAADPQRDAMRFMRKAVPTHQYLVDISSFLKNSRAALRSDGAMMFVVAHKHTFYSHRRQEIEHVVSGVQLYDQIASAAGLHLQEEITMELLKSAASRARPRAKDDYSESILVFKNDQVVRARKARKNTAA